MRGLEETRLEDSLLLAPPGMSNMASLAAITMALTMMMYIKMATPERPRDLNGVREFGCGEDCTG
jgi:hypothetical protein